MADGDQPPRCTAAPARGRGTQPCRPVPRVHTFGKGGQALRRDPHTPPTMRGWLHKQDSSGLRLWKRRWFVLVDLCLYYYRDSSEQEVRGGLPLPGYEIRVLPPASRSPQFLFTAEHPGMRTYCLGAETPEELKAWVCVLRQGASLLPGSQHSLSLQTTQEAWSVGSPSPPLPSHWCSLCPAGEELGLPPTSPPLVPLVPPLPPSKERTLARGGPCGSAGSRGAPGGPLPGAAPAVPAAAGGSRSRPGAAAAPALTPPPRGRSLHKTRPPAAETNQPPLPAGERHTAANQTPASPIDSCDWLLAPVGSGGAPPPSGTASPPAANETWSWAGGRGSEREGVAGRGARRPIRITVLQASF
ncbi:pleckstrin homology domain-containing family A member 4-like isoform X2 [Colius striatus]|uniref:pleckstrin homology domain-containing family A member 4-like isoform X2 n=1 Tax=Colius striatus TaxID=57412 RepID=UPI002B1CE8B2|nr:pleckstrin homology domain-containing family A member 4-like isoform X2 [Colius striatus]